MLRLGSATCGFHLHATLKSKQTSPQKTFLKNCKGFKECTKKQRNKWCQSSTLTHLNSLEISVPKSLAMWPPSIFPSCLLQNARTTFQQICTPRACVKIQQKHYGIAVSGRPLILHTAWLGSTLAWNQWIQCSKVLCSLVDAFLLM